MEGLDFWRLCDQLSVVQAALLIVGNDPGDFGDDLSDHEQWNLPKGYLAAVNALQNAVTSGSIEAVVRRSTKPAWMTLPINGEPAFFNDGTMEYIREVPIDWLGTRIEVASLKTWLRARGFASGFFFPYRSAVADYLDRNEACFSPKLAAAVKAWEAVRADPALTKGKSPKQALIKWLNEHAATLGIAGEDGTLIAKTVEDIATVANWNTLGGAPKTPTSSIVEEPDYGF